MINLAHATFSEKQTLGGGLAAPMGRKQEAIWQIRLAFLPDW
jgi:hypothetical protein